MPWAAIITALRPEPQTLFTVTAETAGGKPPPKAAWRAGFWPRPAWITQPMITSSTSSGATPARLTLSRTTIAPSSVAVKPFKEPKSFPTGVLTALMITASLISDILLLQNYLLFTITIYPEGCQGRLVEPMARSLDSLWVEKYRTGSGSDLVQPTEHPG